MIEEINGLVGDTYEPAKKTRYVELHNRVFPFGRLDPECKYCGSKAFYELTKYLKENTMAKEVTTEKAVYELINPANIATVKMAFGFLQLSKDSDQATLEMAYKAGHTNYVKKVGE